jgi:hypothetical protein
MPVATARLSEVAWPRIGRLSISSHIAACAGLRPRRSLPISSKRGVRKHYLYWRAQEAASTKDAITRGCQKMAPMLARTADGL